MEPHSRLVPPQNGTFGLPQALICLLRTCLVGLSGDSATQADTDLSIRRAIRDSGRGVLLLLNPFVHYSSRTTSTLVGMVKLTALCGIGYWAWTKRSNKGKNVVAPDGTSNQGRNVVDAGKSSHDSAPTEPGRHVM